MRLAALLAVLALLVPAPAALAQGAFQPLPPAAPTVTPTPEPDDALDEDAVGRATLYVIGALLLVVFAALTLWITRDARRSAPAEARPAPDTRRLAERKHRHDREGKARARKRAQAARAARKRNR